MIVVTGGSGFIGSALVALLNAKGEDDVLVVDDLGTSGKWRNLVGKNIAGYEHKTDFLDALERNAYAYDIDAIVHLGACSSTTERDVDYLMRNNTGYTRRLAEWSLAHSVRFIYASSAATYGDGALGFLDDDGVTPRLRPLNPYGFSKQVFDAWALRRRLLEKIAGLKFFNVFGPNEYHKGDMASVVMKAHRQIVKEGKVRLFRSYRSDYLDGGQMRDFVYVKECTAVIVWLLEHPSVNGLYNLGSGKARSWNDLAATIFTAMKKRAAIEYIDMPEGVIDAYQYYTEAPMEKLRSTGCPIPCLSLEAAVTDYVQNYLEKPNPYL